MLENLGAYAGGMRTTIVLTLLSFALALAIGLVVATCRVSPIAPLRGVGTLYVELARNTPLTLLLLIGFFALPDIGLTFDPFPTAVLGLAIYTGAFVAEAVRSGINTVGTGQVEAARSIGLSYGQVLGLVVLPQAIRAVIPPLGNLFIALTKNSSVAFAIAVVELTGIGRNLANTTGRPLQTLAGSAVGYLILLLPASAAIGVLERRVAIRR